MPTRQNMHISTDLSRAAVFHANRPANHAAASKAWLTARDAETVADICTKSAHNQTQAGFHQY
jgi:hypothetical protein